VDDKDRPMLSFQVSVEEMETINARARESGLSRSEYLRQQALNPPLQGNTISANNPPSKDTTILLQHVLYGLQCVHAAIYAMAETSGTLTTAQADTIAQGSMKAGREFLAHMDERITAVRQQIKPAEAEAQSKNEVEEVKANGLSRSV
jgi:hypothetical protein